ncbi:Tn3 family transposase [Thermomonospora umbrina]|uniref:Tn3 family transposase n=1 Tax=Thermomonospora umbrina TaxID=111806 RepID=UPI0014777086|nr:Tn3 family transposase [Thermomonospora umbrina]
MPRLGRNKIQTQWSDMTRVAESRGNPTPLERAFAEHGRIDKSLHLLDILDPIGGGYRRTLNRQLTVQEARLSPLGPHHLNWRSGTPVLRRRPEG